MTRAVSIRNQLKRYLERFGMDVSESLNPNNAPLGNGMSKTESIRRCLTSGYFAHASRMAADGTFRTVDGGTVLHAHPSSLMFNRKADWVVFTEVSALCKDVAIREEFADSSKNCRLWRRARRRSFAMSPRSRRRG